MGRLEATALVDRDVDQHRPGAHLGDELVGDQVRGPGADDEDRADDDVRLEADLLDRVLGGGDGLELAAEVVVDLAQLVEVAIEDEHLGVHADGDGGGGEAGHPGAEDDHAGAADAGHAARPARPAPRPGA